MDWAPKIGLSTQNRNFEQNTGGNGSFPEYIDGQPGNTLSRDFHKQTYGART